MGSICPTSSRTPYDHDPYDIVPAKIAKLDPTIVLKEEKEEEELVEFEEDEITHSDPEEEGCVLGYGAFAMVYKVKISITKEKMYKRRSMEDGDEEAALKKFYQWYGQKPRESYSKERAVEKFKTEAQLISCLSHKNIIRCLGYCTDMKYFGILLELCPGGSLRRLCSMVNNKNSISVKTLINWAKQIAVGMEYLTAKGYVHRDLKAENVLVKQIGCVCLNEKYHSFQNCQGCNLDLLSLKLADFGVAKTLETVSQNSEVGTYAWLAPEAFRSQKWSEVSDVWSFGVVLWEIMAREEPFKGKNPFAVAFSIAENGQSLSSINYCPKEWEKIMKMCWEFQPEKRPRFQQIVTFLEEYSRSVKNKEISIYHPPPPRTGTFSYSPQRQMALNPPQLTMHSYSPFTFLKKSGPMRVQDNEAWAASACALPRSMQRVEKPKHRIHPFRALEIVLFGETDYERRRIGVGGTSVVYSVTISSTNHPDATSSNSPSNAKVAALKQYNRDFGQTPGGSFSKDLNSQKVVQGANLLGNLVNDNVIQILGYCTETPYLGLVLEMCHGGSLQTLCLSIEKEIPGKALKNWAKQVANGMKYLTSEGYVHRDLKANNVLIKQAYCLCNSDTETAHCTNCRGFGLERLQLKISNLELVTKVNSNAEMDFQGSYAWMAPEIFREQKYSEASDVWAFGVLLWEILARDVPYKEENLFAVAYKVAKERKTLPIDEGWSDEWKMLISNCWMFQRDERPGFEELLDNLKEFSSD